MSPKKSKRSQAAQQLIDDLLEDKPSSKSPTSTADPNAREIAMTDITGTFGPVEKETSTNIVFESNESPTGTLQLEGAPKKPPFEGDAPVVTQMVQRSKIVRTEPPRPEPVPVAPQDADVDFSAMSSADPYEKKAPTAAAPAGQDDRTVRVAGPGTLVSPPEPRSEVIQMPRPIDRGGATEIRSGVKIPPSPKVASAGAAPTSIEAGLKQSESLRIAQNRIIELERELERVRRDNEDLSTAGDTLRRRVDELTSKAEALDIQAREAGLRLEEEKKVLRGQLQAKERDNAEMKARVEEIEARLESNFKKIRVRERELEHRLEIVKMESATLVSTKDRMLLDLKRQIDQLHQESDSAKMKSQELFSQYKEKQDTIRRVVRALRIALTILEGDDETAPPIKKAE